MVFAIEYGTYILNVQVYSLDFSPQKKKVEFATTFKKVYRTSNPLGGWDGTWNGREQQSGTYVWVAKGVDFRGKPIQGKGTVIIIR